MKKLGYFMFILLNLFILASCSNKNSEKANIDTTTNNESDSLSINTYNIMPKLKNYNFKGELSNDNLGDIDELDIKNSIQELIDEIGYDDTDEYLEPNQIYRMSYVFNASLENDYNDINVLVNGNEANFNILGNSLNFEYTTPDTVGDSDINVSIYYNDKKEEHLFEDNRKINVKENKYDIKINNAKADYEKYSLDCTITSLKNNPNENLYFVVSNGTSIEEEFKLNEGLNHLDLNVSLGNTYEYAIVNKNKNGKINGCYYKGLFSSLLPFKVVINDVSSSFVSLNIQSKRNYSEITNLTIDNIKYESSRNVLFTKDNLNPDTKYKFEIECDYKGKHYVFYKTIKTLKENEVLVDQYVDVNRISFIDKNSEYVDGRYQWDNGTYINMFNVKGPDITFKTSIFLSGNGKIESASDGTLNYTGGIYEIVIDKPSILSLEICSTGTSDTISKRICNLTNGMDFYYLEVYRLGDRVNQSVYLDKGTYYLYSSTEALRIYDLSIKKIVTQSEAEGIWIDFNRLECLNMTLPIILRLNNYYDFSNYKFYVYNDNGIRKQVNVDAYLGDTIIPNSGYVDDKFETGEKLTFRCSEYNLSLDVTYATSDVLTSVESIDYIMYHLNNDKDFGIDTTYSINGKSNTKNTIYDSSSGYVYYTCKIYDGDNIYESFNDIPKDVLKNYTAEITYHLNSSEITISTIVKTFSLEFDYQNIDTIYYDKMDLEFDYITCSEELLNELVFVTAIVKTETINDTLSYNIREWKEKYNINLSVKNYYNSIAIFYENKQISNLIPVVKSKSDTIYRFDGEEAGKDYKNYDAWDIEDDSNRLGVTMVNPNVGEENDSSITDGINVLKVYNTTVITSKTFSDVTNGIIYILTGTKDSNKPFEILVECLDENDNVVYTTHVFTKPNKIIETDYNYVKLSKITHGIYICVNTKFNKVRLSKFLNDNTEKYLGIISIDIIDLKNEALEEEKTIGNIINASCEYGVFNNTITFKSGYAEYSTDYHKNYVTVRLNISIIDSYKVPTSRCQIVGDYIGKDYLDVLVLLPKNYKQIKFSINLINGIRVEYIAINEGLELEVNTNDIYFDSNDSLYEYNEGEEIKANTTFGQFEIIGDNASCYLLDDYRCVLIPNDKSTGIKIILDDNAKITVTVRAIDNLSSLVILDPNGNEFFKFGESDGLRINNTKAIQATIFGLPECTIVAEKANESDDNGALLILRISVSK